MWVEPAFSLILKPLGSDSETLDGLNPHFVIAAELLYSDIKNDMKLSGYDFTMDGPDLLKLKVDDQIWGGSFAYGIKSGAFRTEIEANLRSEAKKNSVSYDEIDDSFDLGKSRFQVVPSC